MIGQASIQIAIGQKRYPAPSRGMEEPGATFRLITAILKKTGWKQEKLAERLGTSQSQVSRWRNGASANFDDGVRIKALAIEVGALTSRDGAFSLTSLLRVRGSLRAPDMVTLGTGDDAVRLAQVSFPIPEDCFAMEVEANGATTRARKGDLLVVGPLYDELTSLVGQEVLVLRPDGTYAFGTLVHGSASGTWGLVGVSGMVFSSEAVSQAAPYRATLSPATFAFRP